MCTRLSVRLVRPLVPLAVACMVLSLVTAGIVDASTDWGEARWDLIVLSYVGAREYAATVVRVVRLAAVKPES